MPMLDSDDGFLNADWLLLGGVQKGWGWMEGGSKH